MLTWEKQYYAGVVFGVISCLYLVLWYLDLSLITLLSLLGVISILLNYAFPMVSRLIFGGVNWDGDQEAKFEDVCGQVCAVKGSLVVWYEYLFNERKSTVVSRCGRDRVCNMYMKTEKQFQGLVCAVDLLLQAQV